MKKWFLRLNSRDNLLPKSIQLLAILTIFILLFFSVTSVLHRIVEIQVKKHYFISQKAMSFSIAKYLNQKIVEAHQHVILAAAYLNGKDINRIDTEDFIDNHQNLLAIFKNGIFLFSKDGFLLCENPKLYNRQGQTYSFRNYIKETLKTNSPIISEPYISSKSHGHLCIMLTAPVYNKSGQISAIFSGSIDLEISNFISDILKISNANNNNFLLISNQGMIISHYDASKLYSKLNKENLLQNQKNSVFDDKKYIINSISYTNWLLLCDPYNQQMYDEINGYKKVINICVFIVLLLLLVCFLIYKERINRYFNLIKENISLEKINQNSFNPLDSKGPSELLGLIDSINTLIIEYRNFLFHNREIEQDIYNLLIHSSAGFASFKTSDLKISTYNDYFLKLCDKSANEIKNGDILNALFNDFELYYKPFNNFIDSFDTISNSAEFNIINKNKKQIRVIITAYKLHLMNEEQIALIIENKEIHAELHHQNVLCQNITDLVLEYTNDIIHILDTTGKLKVYNPLFKINFTAYQNFIDKPIWDLLDINKEKVEVESFINGLKTFTESSKHFIVHLKNRKTQELDLYHLYYYIITDKNDQKAMLLGFLRK